MLGGLLRAGAGTDTLMNASTGPFSGVLSVDFTATQAESYIGSAGDERVDATGSAANVRLIGNAGNDELIGGLGNDTIAGGAGSDTLTGGDGNDTLFFDADDVLGGLLRAGAGTDTLINASSGPFSGVLNVDFTATQAESYSGSAGDERVDATGSTVNVRLIGNAGNDELIGGLGNDTLGGGDGADILKGGAGNDSLFGNAGNDVFAFSDDWGRDVIADFQDGVDLVSLSVLGLTSFEQLTITQNGSHAVVTFGDDTIVIANTNVLAIDASDFIF